MASATPAGEGSWTWPMVSPVTRGGGVGCPPVQRPWATPRRSRVSAASAAAEPILVCRVMRIALLGGGAERHRLFRRIAATEAVGDHRVEGDVLLADEAGLGQAVL